MAIIKGQLTYYFCGKWYYAFLFEKKEDRDMIFRNGPYFMDTRRMYLNKWTLYFDRKVDIQSSLLVWV